MQYVEINSRYGTGKSTYKKSHSYKTLTGKEFRVKHIPAAGFFVLAWFFLWMFYKRYVHFTITSKLISMEQHHEKKSTPASFNESFDCNKMKSLLMDNSSVSFGEKFKHWLDAYTKTAREKIWTDIEYYKSW